MFLKTKQFLLAQNRLLLSSLLDSKRLRIHHPYSCPVNIYFAQSNPIHTATLLSTSQVDGREVSGAWGVAFVNCDHPVRCSKIHISYLGETDALHGLYKELTKIS